MEVSKRTAYKLATIEHIAKTYSNYGAKSLEKVYVDAISEISKQTNREYSTIADAMTRRSNCNKKVIINDIRDFLNGNPNPLKNRFEASCDKKKFYNNDMQAIADFFNNRIL